jgi:hypothetical protein
MATENAVMDKLELGIFFAAMIALVACGCIFTRRPTRKPAAQHNESKPIEPSPTAGQTKSLGENGINIPAVRLARKF